MTLSVVPPMPSAHCQSRVLKTQSIHSDNRKRGGVISDRRAQLRIVASGAIDGICERLRVGCPFCANDRDRGEPCGSTPPTPPYVRVRIRRVEKVRLTATINDGEPR